MKTVGIIANPASGKDIRRLIASGTVVTNQEKINIVIRMLKAMDALGVERVTIMPDPSHIGQRVIEEVASELATTTLSLLELPYLLGTWKDSLRSAQMMGDDAFACIVVLGGDGTSRVVAKACGEVPVLPVSTGTNNVFPQMIEGTLAGMAAGLLATGRVSHADACRRAPQLELRDSSGELIDIALVDLVVVDSRDLGSRAVWEEAEIHELFITVAQPGQIGLSAVGAWLSPLTSEEPVGLYIELDPAARQKVLAPIAPGLMVELGIVSHRRFAAGENLPVTLSPAVIALDGEREVIVGEGEELTVNYSIDGPWVLDIQRTLQAAAQAGVMLH